MVGSVEFKFFDDVLNFNARLSEERCTETFSQLKGIEQLSCQREYVNDATFISYIITIDKFSIFPFENNINFHNGNPDVSSFSCQVEFPENYEVEGGYCEITDEQTENLPGIKRNYINLLIYVLFLILVEVCGALIHTYHTYIYTTVTFTNFTLLLLIITFISNLC